MSSSAARRSHSVAVRGEGLRVAAVRRSSSARSTASCCLRRKVSTRSTTSRSSTGSNTNNNNTCGYCLTRSGAAVSRKTSTASTNSATQHQQQQQQQGRRRSSGSGVAECRRRVGQHPHLATEEAEGQEATTFRHLAELVGRRGVGEAAAKQVARQVSEALQHIHARGVVHRDVLPDNIQVEGRRPIMLRLAGLHMAAEEGAMVRRGDCQEAWLSPEVLTLLPAEGYAAHPSQDAWQLGLLLVACLTGSLPWAAADPTDPHYAAWSAWARRASTRMPPRFRNFSPRFLRLLRRLLQPRPDLRAGVREVDKYLQDAWLGGEEAKGPASGKLKRRMSGLLTRAGVSLTRLLGPAPPQPHTPTRVSFTDTRPDLLPSP